MTAVAMGVLPDAVYGPDDEGMLGRYELEATALHEAAHGVVGLARNLPVRYATVRARHGGGAVNMNYRSKGGYPSRDMIAILAAGAIVEDLAGVDRWEAGDTASSDLRCLRDVAWDWFRARPDGPTVLELIAGSWALAYDLIVANWGAIGAIAVQLIESPRAVTAREMTHLMDTADTVKPEDALGRPLPVDARTFWLKDYTLLRKWNL